MTDTSNTGFSSKPDSIFTPPSLPKGGGTVSTGGGMFSSGGPDGAANWSLPVPLPSGRTLSPSLALQYSSGGGDSVFGAGWVLSIPAILRMDRLGIPRYTSEDRLIGPDGQEILRDKNAPRSATRLPFASANSGPYEVTTWVPRNGVPVNKLEHWVKTADLETDPAAPGFWLQWHPDGGITLFGWSAQARLSDPKNPAHVACWYIQETVDATGEHVVYVYRNEDHTGCSPEELSQHPQVANVYLKGVYAMNKIASQSLLVPEGRFVENDFMTFMLTNYGECGTDPSVRPSAQASGEWLLRSDCRSYWRYGFNMRTRRLCRDMMLWHRTKMLAGENSPEPQLVSRLHLKYEESGVASMLVSATSVAYETSGLAMMLPPVEFSLSMPGDKNDAWELVEPLNGFSPPRWQFADLYGEGIPGLLYQDQGAWWYRAPERDKQKGAEAITWGRATPLAQIPGLKNGSLMDMDGDGYSEWIVTGRDYSGSFTLSSEGTWGQFVPVRAMPTEFMHRDAILADLTGNGLQDLVMIGLRNVRLWPSAGRDGWQPFESVVHTGATPLPVVGSETELVTFADPAGSGQQHLVKITGNALTYWPSLGHGRFGDAITVPGLAIDNFDASRVFLGDTDGSGTTDILYIEPDRIRVFISESGNRYTETASVPAPVGITLDYRCVLHVADVRGQGMAELMLTVPGVEAKTWFWQFSKRRPWLLREVCTNTGSRTLLDYRSSAQSWLDEKTRFKEEGRAAVSYLPFPVHTLCEVKVVDDISGIVTGSEMRYEGGVWDGDSREFQGFRRLIQRDTVNAPSGNSEVCSPAAEIRHWFLCGVESLDNNLEGAFESSDSTENNFAVRPLRVIRASRPNEEYNPQGEERKWLVNSLKGLPVRTEVYGLDGSALQEIPYSITRQRWQMTVRETSLADKPAVSISPAESLTVEMERIPSEGRTTQSITLEQDAFGNVLRTVNIAYHRPAPGPHSPRFENLPDGLLKATQDPQQQSVWLTLSRTAFINQSNTQDMHLIGAPDSARSDVFMLEPQSVPQGGFSLESLLHYDEALSGLGASTFGGYSRTQWCDTSNNLVSQPVRQALVAYTETAVLDEEMVAMLADSLPGDVNSLLTQAGYHTVTLPEGATVRVSRKNYIRYLGLNAFCRVNSGRVSALTGETQITWSPHYTMISSVRDAAGLETKSEYDWRFMMPVKIIDPNDNVHEAVADALGRVTESRFRGTEDGVMTGYSSSSFTLPETVNAALQLKGIPVAVAHRTVADSWMPFDRDVNGKIKPERVGELALRKFISKHNLKNIDLREGCEPAHSITMTTDRYDSDPAQQVRISVAFSDGGARLLQTAVLSPPGEAMVRTASGGLQTDAQGKAISVQASVRWAVSGKTEYDNKGRVLRTWLPFYLNDWKPVYDDSAREGIYADTQVYDAMGRVYRVITAAGFERRTQVFPWFIVNEDENDTAEEVSGAML